MTNKPEISVAPMMDWTDRHCRYFHRLISPHVKLYTEMVTTGALIHGDAERFLRFDKSEHPVALQLGGSHPQALAKCTQMGMDAGYDEINLNCGCPSDRVQSGMFGACLMAKPDLVAECISAMVDKAGDAPITVKSRIGIDDQDSFEFLDKFVATIAQAGCNTFIIHARKAWLSGLSPKQNREIPPLHYERVAEIKKKYPELKIILNGGIKTVEQIQTPTSSPELPQAIVRGSSENKNKIPDPVRDDSFCLDGVMIGRVAYQNPYFLAKIEQELFNNDHVLERKELALQFKSYMKKQKEEFDIPIKSMTKHILGLYHNQPRGKYWRRTLSTLPYENGADETVIDQALDSLAS